MPLINILSGLLYLIAASIIADYTVAFRAGWVGVNIEQRGILKN